MDAIRSVYAGYSVFMVTNDLKKKNNKQPLLVQHICFINTINVNYNNAINKTNTKSLYQLIKNESTSIDPLRL